MNISDIESKIISENSDILEQSITFIDSKTNKLMTAGYQTENRATAVMAVAGVLGGIIMAVGNSIFNSEKQHTYTIVILYSSILISLLKTIYCSIRAIYVMKKWEIKPELVYELNKLDLIQSKQQELKWKMWEYYKLLPVAHIRLFWLNRSQQNIVLSFILLIGFGMALLVENFYNIALSRCGNIVLICGLLLIIFLLDIIIERIGGLWKKE